MPEPDVNITRAWSQSRLRASGGNWLYTGKIASHALNDAPFGRRHTGEPVNYTSDTSILTLRALLKREGLTFREDF